MADEPRTVTLPPAASQALIEIAERTGQPVEQLAVDAVELFVAGQTAIAEKVALALDQVRNGQSVSYEDAVRRFRATIAEARLKRA